jgi:hypothetical protein
MLQTIADMASLDDRKGRGIRRDYSLGSTEPYMLQNPMRLDDVLSRDLRLQWFEGVAIVMAICRQLIEARRTDGFPPEQAVAIDAAGTVTVRGTPATGDAVPIAARMLSGMLADDFPVQLRLVMGQAADGAYGALEDFANALAYYERPDSAQILRTLYERASQAPRREGRDLPVDEPEPARLAAPLSSDSAARGERWPLVAAALVVGLIIGVILVLEFGSGSAQVDAAIGHMKGTLSRTLGVVSADSVVEQPVEPVPLESTVVRPAARTAARRASSSVARAAAGSNAADALPAVPLFSPSLLRPDDRPLLDLVSPPETRFYSTMTVVASRGEEARAAADGERIYTRRDSNVIPPRAVYPQFPAAPEGGAAPGQTIVDLVIDPTGHVEGARLRTAPRNIHEFMLLSATKAWRFDPAVHEDGHPVRFRHSVVITAYP